MKIDILTFSRCFLHGAPIVESAEKKAWISSINFRGKIWKARHADEEPGGGFSMLPERDHFRCRMLLRKIQRHSQTSRASLIRRKEDLSREEPILSVALWGCDERHICDRWFRATGVHRWWIGSRIMIDATVRPIPEVMARSLATKMIVFLWPLEYLQYTSLWL